ncbi:MAG: fibronectin type III domain-containing protein [Terriglobales bacterium]
MCRNFRYALVLLLAFALTSAVAAQHSQTQPTNGGARVRVTQGPLIQYVDEALAVVTWTTDLTSDTRIYYGTDANNLNRIAEADGYSTMHRVNLTGLSPSTTYYFQIDTGDMQPSAAEPVASFQTVAQGASPLQNQRPQMAGTRQWGNAPQPAAQPAAKLSVTGGPTIQFADESSAVITWTTNLPAESSLYYGMSPNNLSSIADGPGNTTNHRVHILSLNPNTTYYFQIQQGPGQSPTAVNSFRTISAGGSPIYNQPVAIAVAPPRPPSPPNRSDEGFGQRQPAYTGQGMQVPAGTEIDATLQNTLSSKTSYVGEKFSAVIRGPVRSTTGAVAIPAGSVVHGEVTEVVGGKTLPSVRGRGKLNLRFVDIAIPNGPTIPLAATLESVHDRTANEEGQVQSGTKGSTVAKDVGIGAGLGTVAGLIFGSALKGLLIGAIAGGGYVLATGGKDVELPADSGLKLRLDNNVTVPVSGSDNRWQSWDRLPASGR